MASSGKGLTNAEVLGELIELQGEYLVVSYSIDDMRAFSFFDATLVRGPAVNHPGLLGHDEESIELEFSNGILITIDPTKSKAAAVEMDVNEGKVVKLRIGDVRLSQIADGD